jgi:hypothetical protein
LDDKWKGSFPKIADSRQQETKLEEVIKPNVRSIPELTAPGIFF